MQQIEKDKLLLNKRIIRARQSLCKMFNIKAKYLTHNTNRKRNVIDARRFLTYYMYNDLGIKYNHMKKYIIGMHHATALYQCRKLGELLQFEKPLRKKYNTFISESNDLDVLNILLKGKRAEAVRIKNDINEIYNNIKLKRNEDQSTNQKNPGS